MTYATPFSPQINAPKARVVGNYCRWPRPSQARVPRVIRPVDASYLAPAY